MKSLDQFMIEEQSELDKVDGKKNFPILICSYNFCNSCSSKGNEPTSIEYNTIPEDHKSVVIP